MRRDALQTLAATYLRKSKPYQRSTALRIHRGASRRARETPV